MNKDIEIDNLFTSTKEVKIELVTPRESPLDEFSGTSEKSFRPEFITKPSLELGKSSHKQDNDFPINFDDPEKHLEVMSLNLRNSASKLGANKMFDFSKKITFPTTESDIKTFSNYEEPGLMMTPPLKKNSMQKLPKPMFGKEDENPTVENFIPQSSTKRDKSNDKFKKRPLMLDIQNPNDKVTGTNNKLKELEKESNVALELNDENSSKAISTKNLLALNIPDKAFLNPIPKKGLKKQLNLQLNINNFDPEPVIQVKEIISEPQKAEETKEHQDFNSAKPVMKKKKPTFGSLALDIDTINENYTFGGEQGKQVASDMDHTMDKLFQEVSELARECVAYMSKFAFYLLY